MRRYLRFPFALLDVLGPDGHDRARLVRGNRGDDQEGRPRRSNRHLHERVSASLDDFILGHEERFRFPVSAPNAHDELVAEHATTHFALEELGSALSRHGSTPFEVWLLNFSLTLLRATDIPGVTELASG